VLDKTLEYLMHCYFHHQEKCEEVVVQNEDLLASKRCQCNPDDQNLMKEVENAHRKIEVSCLHTYSVQYY